jgi:hypothetical protein
VNAPNKQELQIVQAFSSISVPEKVIRDSNIKELVQDMLGKQTAVRGSADRLEKLRQEKRDGNFLGNWWNDRDDKVQDAQLDLSSSIGRLTETSSRLLVVNTAISKVLSDQQNILLKQQRALEEQAQELKSQNEKILDQQQQLAKQQQKINAANKGLMEAKGLTQAQAEKLVGCVVRVSEAERKIEFANEQLRKAMRNEMQASLAQCAARVDAAYAEFSQAQAEYERKIQELLAANMRQTQKALAQSERELKTQLSSELNDVLAAVNQKAAEQHAEIEQQRALFERELRQTSQDLIGRVEQTSASMRENQAARERAEGELRADMNAKLSQVQATVDQKTAEQHAELEQQRALFERELQQTSQDLIGRVEQTAASMRENQEALARLDGQLRADMDAKLGDVLATVNQKTAEQDANLEQQRAFFEHELQQTSHDLIGRVEQAAASMRENQEALARSEDQLKTETIAKLDNLLAAVNQKIAAQHDDLEQQRTYVERELQQTAQDSIHRINAAQAAQASNSRKTGWAVAAAAGLSLLSLGWQVVSHISAG